MIKGKTLVDKETKEFVVIEYYGGEVFLATCSIPKISPVTATIESLIAYYEEYHPGKIDDVDFTTIEFKDVEINIL